MSVRVCMVVNNLEVGGLEKVVLSLLARMDRERFEPYLLCLNGEGKLFADAAVDADHARALTKRPMKVGPLSVDFRSLTNIRRFLIEKRVDILHAHNAAPLIYAGLAARTLVPRPLFVYSEHNQVYSASPASKARFRYYVKLADHIINVSHDLERTLRDQLKIKLPMTVIHNGIDGERFKKADGDSLREELGVQSDEVLIGTGVVLSKQKGIEYLIEAAKKVVAKVPKARFVVAGDGPLREELTEQAKSAELGDRWLFLGYRKDMPRVISALDVYVLPSLWEGLPLALLEAMAIGKPIVCTRVGGSPEVVEHEVNGLVVEPGQVEPLAQALIRVAESSELRRDFSEKNRATFESRFSEQAMTRAHEELFIGLLDGSRPRARFFG